MSAPSESIGDSYDQIPYNSVAFMQAAPEHLHAVAHLFGLKSPAPASARVLELGCAAGGNLIPFAAHHPNATMIGVDLSGVQVATGQRAISAMGLTNIELRHESITAIGPELGQFDYIICHGVYSWVPEDVREAILRISRENLTPQGIAYVSYNVYPGWKAKEIVRDAMLLRAQAQAGPREKLRHARAMIDFLHGMAREGSLLKKVMTENIQTIRHGTENYLVHEFLEPFNQPCYFRDFVAAAQRHGLAYLAESGVAGMFADNHGSEAAEALLRECGGSQVVLEQILDFLSSRAFRQTLLVHADRIDDIRYQIEHSRLESLHVAGQFTPVPGLPDCWLALREARIFALLPEQKAVLENLRNAWPATVAVRQLVEAAQQVTGGAEAAVAECVLQFVQDLVLIGGVHFRLSPVRTLSSGDCPTAPAPLRQLAALKQAEALPVSLYNAWHGAVDVGDPAATLLWPLLDGNHDRAALIQVLLDAARDDKLALLEDGETMSGCDAMAKAATEQTEALLERMHKLALFMTPE